MADPSPVRVRLVGHSPADVDRLRRLIAADSLIEIVDDPADADAVLITPEALRHLEGHRERPGSEAPSVETLTARERDVLAYAAEGHGNREIGRLLGISEHTVKFHLASIYGKLGVGNRTEAVQRALRTGLLEI